MKEPKEIVPSGESITIREIEAMRFGLSTVAWDAIKPQIVALLEKLGIRVSKEKLEEIAKQWGKKKEITRDEVEEFLADIGWVNDKIIFDMTVKWLSKLGIKVKGGE